MIGKTAQTNIYHENNKIKKFTMSKLTICNPQENGKRTLMYRQNHFKPKYFWAHILNIPKSETFWNIEVTLKFSLPLRQYTTTIPIADDTHRHQGHGTFSQTGCRQEVQHINKQRSVYSSHRSACMANVAQQRKHDDILKRNTIVCIKHQNTFLDIRMACARNTNRPLAAPVPIRRK